ncbi:nucleoside-diphosphate sugar epimerase/dehydratase [Rhodovibrio salinarum]|uniref:Polysaccharide biosynthesis protein n=1 Tax=Rhodovibrio salinarum TaxID=1087 RepID=A0A934UZF1_9PROT|nr:nucleoside-diphosphate sugar epimerase/dehydratase [Rhodovibrio salinarum]MBK1696673.1 polysaccharide biosynthesis protein [Rhodovibrio salinarum]
MRGVFAARYRRAAVAFVHDAVMAALACVLAFALRLGDGVTAYLRDPEFWLVVGIFTAVCAGVFWFMGLYRGIWRYASVQDVIAIVKAVTLSLLIFLPITFLMTRLDAMPRSVLVIAWLLLVVMLAGPRMIYRVFRDRGFQHVLEWGASNRVPVLLVGAGDAADLFIRDTTRDPDSPYEVVGIVDEKGTRVGRRIRGVPVMGDLADVDRVVAALARRGRAPQRFIQTRGMTPEVLRQLLDKAEAHGAQLSRLPNLTDFRDSRTDGRGKVELRPVALEDLLQRPQATLDRNAMRAFIAGRRVLVTGAGGSIGSELARQACEFGAGRLVLLDHSETLLYNVGHELAESFPETDRRSVLADVRSRAAVDGVFAAEQPEVVLHAAAIKHVPLAEDNPPEAALTNVIGTRNVADSCCGHGVAAMVLISTDKAINPTSVMGATKRLAECYAQACDVAERERAKQNGGTTTRFTTVRFGNVLGSAGSVVPLFTRQIQRGGPVTVTHPEMTRYFMTVREAVQLVLQAASLSQLRDDGDDVGKVYVLDMGEPVKIVDLARQMIRLAGLRPDKDIRIEFTGVRAGEKLHEELFHHGEPTVQTAYSGLRLAAARTANVEVLHKAIEELENLALCGAVAEVIEGVHRQVPEFRRSQQRASTAQQRDVVRW